MENKENRVKMDKKRVILHRKTTYRKLLQKVNNLEDADDVGLTTINAIGEILHDINDLDKKYNFSDIVEHTEGTLMDARILASTSGLLKKCIEAVDVYTSTYDATELSNVIVSSLKDGNDNFNPEYILKLSADANNLVPPLPRYLNVYGTYDVHELPQPKMRSPRKIQEKQKSTKKMPEKVVNVEKEEESMESILKILRDVLVKAVEKNEGRPVNYYDYVLDTEDFGITVENMFYCSFLIRDGKVCLDLDKYNSPIIKPVGKSELNNYRSRGGSNVQVIATITMEQWENLCIAMQGRTGLIQRYRKRMGL